MSTQTITLEKPSRLPAYEVVSRSEWLVARKDLLSREKEFSRQRDALSAARRALPQLSKIDTSISDGIGGDRFVRRQRRFDATTNPEVLGAVRFDLFATSGDGGKAVFIHRGPRSAGARHANFHARNAVNTRRTNSPDFPHIFWSVSRFVPSACDMSVHAKSWFYADF